MGQKVHPFGFRLGVIRDWQSRWFADKDYREFVIEDEKIRQYLRTRLKGTPATGGGNRRPGGRGGRPTDAGLSQIAIERMANMIKVTLHTARPGIIIGRGGRGIDELRMELEKITPRKVQLNVLEIKNPELDALLVAESVASQIERRVSFKRAIRLAIARTMQRGGKGIKIIVGGRLGGAEIARSYSDKDGKIPLHTLRADIDYGAIEARTQYGNIGVKVWIYRGEILPGTAPVQAHATGAARPQPAPRPYTTAPPAASPVSADSGEKKAKGWRRVSTGSVAPVVDEALVAVEEIAVDVPSAEITVDTPPDAVIDTTATETSQATLNEEVAGEMPEVTPDASSADADDKG